ncbi:MAG: tetratricopeptide repeat protein [Cyclobacteriaceae bacterium]
MKLRTVLILFVCLIGHQSFAQSDTYWFAFKVTSVEKKTPSKVLVTIDRGTELGLKKGDQGEVWTTLQRERKEECQFLSTLVLQEVATQRASGLIEVEEPIYEGDILFVKIPIKSGFHSSYFYLLSYNILLTDEADKPYYTFDEIMQSDGHPLRTEKFIAMQMDINEAGGKLKTSGNTEKVKEGPNKGRFLHEVLAATDTTDVWNYLYYITLSYTQTLGQTIPLVKGFSDYTREGDLATSAELKNLFVGVNAEVRESRFDYYKHRITKSLLGDWAKEAKELREKENYAESQSILEACIYLSSKLNDPYEEGLYSYEMALVFDNQSQYDSSIYWYEASSQKFKVADNSYGEGYAQHYLARAYEKLERITEAVDHYKKAISFRKQLLEREPANESYQSELYTSLDALANLSKEELDYKTSLDYYNQALEVALAGKDKSLEADTYWNLGYVNTEGFQLYQKGIENYEQAYRIYITLADSASCIDMKRNQAINYEKLKMLPNARQAIAEGVALARSWGNQNKLAYALDYQGLLAYDHKEYTQATTSYLESEKIYGQLQNNEKLLKTKKNLAEAYRDSRKYSLALVKLQERTKLVKPDDLSTKADVLWDLALLNSIDYLNTPKKGIDLYQQVEKIYIDLKDTVNHITILNNIAYQYRDLKDSINAYKFHQKALGLCTSLNLLAKRADTYERLGFTYGQFENWRKQVGAFNESLKIYNQLNDIKKEGYILESIAVAYKKMEKYDDASNYYKQSIALYKKAGSKSDEAETYWDYAYNIGENLRQYEDAIANYRIAYGLYMGIADSVNASTMLSNVGQTYWSELNYDQAIESHRAAIELAMKCKNFQQVAKSWSKLATLYVESNNPIASTEALKNQVVALQQINDSTALSSAYNDLAGSYLKSKDYNSSFDYYNRAIAIRKVQKDSVNWVLSMYDLAGAYQNKNEYKRAEKLYTETLVLQRKLKDKNNQAYTLANLGLLAQADENDYKKANNYYQEAIRLGTELKDDNIIAYCYLRMKGLNRVQGNFKIAEEYIKKALGIYTKINQPKNIAYTLVEMGNDAAYVYGDNTKALQLLDQAQVIADTIADVTLKAYLLGVRGNIMAEMGEFQKALDLAGQSLDLYKKTENEWGLAGVYIDIGNIYKQLSENEQSLHFQQMSDSLYIKLNAEYNRLAPLANIGAVYTVQGDYKKGLEYYEKSLAIMKKAGDFNENVGIVQASIGESYFYLNDFVQSDKWLRESINTFDKVGAIRPKMDALSVVGRLKIEEGKFEEAAKYLNEGIKVSKEKSLKLSYVSNLGLLGQLEVERKDFSKAKPLLEECMKSSRDMGKYNTLWESLYWLGVLYKENKQLPQSKQYLTESVEVIEKIRNKVTGGEEAQKLFSSDKNILKVYEALVDVLLQLGETDAAMSYIQKNNEDNLKAKFKGLDMKFENADKNKVITQERNMKAKLDGIEEQISNEKALPSDKQNLAKLKNLEGTKTIAEGDYLKFVNQQVNVRPELSKYFNNSIQPAQLKGKKKQIPSDMALLSYLPGETQLYIFIATSDTVIAKVVNIPRAQIIRNVNAVLNLVRSNQGTFDRIDLKSEQAERQELVSELNQPDPTLKPFEELYHYLISPASAEIVDKKRLCIIPNGVLSYIPFQLLGKTLKNGKFSLLINQYSIFYANSTDMLLRSIGTEKREFNILAFGNPDKSLPSTEKEVVELKRLFPSASIFLRDDATEDKAKFAGEEFNVMHFATHGNLDYEDFGKSFLTMASNPAMHEDGLLTLEELWGMDVMSHLNIVVLSACQTAVSKGSDESSPVSPASGFLQNGVKSVVATLWKVDDEATSLLIGDFYKNIKTMDAVDALRQAQVNLSNNPKYSHPFYWAAAVLLGDWR